MLCVGQAPTYRISAHVLFWGWDGIRGLQTAGISCLDGSASVPMAFGCNPQLRSAASSYPADGGCCYDFYIGMVQKRPPTTGPSCWGGSAQWWISTNHRWLPSESSSSDWLCCAVGYCHPYVLCQWSVVTSEPSQYKNKNQNSSHHLLGRSLGQQNKQVQSDKPRRTSIW